MFWAQHNSTPERKVEHTSARGKDSHRKHKQYQIKQIWNEWMNKRMNEYMTEQFQMLATILLVLSFSSLLLDKSCFHTTSKTVF